MDPISFTVGIAGIASIFQSCLHGYRSLNTAMRIGNDALNLNIQFQVEEIRLFLWGRNWGLVKEIKAVEAKAQPNAHPHDSEGEASGSKTAEVSKQPIPLDSVDEELEIPGLRDLTIEVLGRINQALEEWKSLGERYSAAPAGMRTGDQATSRESSRDLATDLLAKVASKQSKETKKISDLNRFTAKLRWALKDKAKLDELLDRLTKLNDSLEKLLPRTERVSLERGLAGEILGLLGSGKNDDSDSEIDDQLGYFRSHYEIKATKIVLLKRSNQTERAERSSEAARSPIDEDNPTPFSKPSVWATGRQGAMEIDPKHFTRLLAPKMKYYEAHQEGSTLIESRYVPLSRSFGIYAPISSTSINTGADTLRTAADTTTSLEPNAETMMQAVLVEWRPTAHESVGSELSSEELKGRRDHIAHLLHRTSVTDTDFRVLDCLGYIYGTGHTPDGSTHELVGYVYRYPDFASPKSLPVSLRDLLGEAYDSDDLKVPSLDKRIGLAQSLSIALYQLQCAGWVHRKISSYNVIFFRDRIQDELDLSQPFLVGWQYSRPDDQRYNPHSEGRARGIGDLDMYVHRDRLIEHTQSRFPRFRKSFDIYSLGIVMIEIAFWEPIMALAPEEERKKMVKYEEVGSGKNAKELWKTILKTAEQELAPEMGVAYQDAVLFCLRKSAKDQGDRKKDRYISDEDDVDTSFEEVGIEKEFYWEVVKRLERIKI